MSPEEMAEAAKLEAERKLEEARKLAQERAAKAKEAADRLKALKERLKALKNSKIPKLPPIPKFKPKELPKDNMKKFKKK
jgi:cell division septum initiation protein DivIVA